MPKLPKTTKEASDYIREQANKGKVTENDLSHDQMNEFIRSGGVMPEKPEPQEKVLTPDEAVKVLEIMSNSGLTYAAAKKKLREDQAAEAKSHKTMNQYIRKMAGKAEDND